MYAILDIESTGGRYNEEGITEIAIYRFDGHEVTDELNTLVNPEKPIQEFVTKLTGINNGMLTDAPKFYEIAKQIMEIIEGCVIVAHNAEFDSRILCTEFKRLGYEFHINSVCTVELCRKLIPNQESYSLGKLCKSLGIPMSSRHRASGDAIATVELFKLLLDKDKDTEIIQQTIRHFNNRTIKEKLDSILEAIPEKMGVFYLHDENAKVIYIGKGNNLKHEVNELFSKDSKRALKIHKRVQNVSCECTENELITKLRYFTELDNHQPKFNLRRKRKSTLEDFTHNNFIIQHKGRELDKNASIVIIENEVVGYRLENHLSSKEEIQLDIESNLILFKNKEVAKIILKKHLKESPAARIIPL